jgi:hypothetical protein
MAKVGYPFSYPGPTGGAATFKRTGEVAGIWNGDSLIDSAKPGSVGFLVSKVWMAEDCVQMVLTPIEPQNVP